MAIPRNSLTDTGDNSGTTNTPLNNNKLDKDVTIDVSKLGQQYQDDTGSNGNFFDTGAMLPRDMTVKLVRAESNTWETFLSIGYSFCLTLFGIFFGSWLGVAEGTNFSKLEYIAMISFGLVSLILIGMWVRTKISQQKNSIKVPYEILNRFSKLDEPKEDDKIKSGFNEN